MALFVAIRYWKAPRSLVRRNSIRFILAIIIALCEICGWSCFFSSCGAPIVPDPWLKQPINA